VGLRKGKGTLREINKKIEITVTLHLYIDNLWRRGSKIGHSWDGGWGEGQVRGGINGKIIQKSCLGGQIRDNSFFQGGGWV